MKKLKDSKGAATLFVLIAGLFFISFILSILMLASVKRQSQIEIGKHTQEIYNELNQDKINEVKNIVPIYTKEQLLKIGSGEEIAIEKENGKKYVYSPDAYYILNSDIELEYNGIWDISQYNIDEAGYKIKIKDTSKPDVAYYYYVDKYDYPVTENGFKYEGLVVQFDGTNNTGNGHSNGTTTWKDLSGNGNNGTLTNFSYSSSSGWRTDRLTFDGKSSYITLQNNPIYTVNENTEYTLNIVVDVKKVKTHNFFCNRTEIGKGISIFLINNIIRCDNGSTEWTTEYEFPVNQKINVTIVKKATEIALYVDGQLLKISNAVGDKTSLHEGVFTIGASQVKNSTTGVVESFNYYLNGDIYLVNIYDKALTELEVKNNYEAEKNRTIDYSEKTKGWDFTKVSNIVKEKDRIAPIPAGYVASSVSGEDTISGGLVIYQGTDAVTSANHSNAMLNRNQYVWIPVDDINDMVMCKQNGNTGTGGATICNLEYNTTTGHITCKTHGYTTETALIDANIDTTGLAGRLYGTDSTTTDTATPKIYTTSMEFTQASKAAHRFSTTETYREPDLVTDYDNSNYQLVLNESSQALASANALKQQLNKKFIEMAKSVAKYGGFYVGRYEAGDNGASLKNQKVLVAGTTTRPNHNPDTYIDGNMWYGMYNTLMSSTAVDKTAVNSHMMWGCQYDMIIKFLSENSVNEPQIGHVTRQMNVQKLTGENTADIMSNIHDLEGNNVEWTVQANETNKRVRRGDNFRFAYTGQFGPASNHAVNEPTSMNCNFASRSVIYVK